MKKILSQLIEVLMGCLSTLKQHANVALKSSLRGLVEQLIYLEWLLHKRRYLSSACPFKVKRYKGSIRYYRLYKCLKVCRQRRWLLEKQGLLMQGYLQQTF